MEIKCKMVLIIIGIFILTGFAFTQDRFPVLKGPYLGQATPDKSPKIFAPGIISLGFHENGIVFSPDGKEMLFSMSDSKFAFKTFVYLKIESGKWSKPELAPFSGHYYDHSAIFTADGKRLYFSSKRPIKPDSAPKKDLDIWFIEKNGQSWGKPVHLSGPLNTDKSEQITSLSANGTMYLRTNYEGKKWSIYTAKLENGRYMAAKKMSSKINKGYNEGNPCISPDERFLLFKSGQPDGYGETDLYVSFKQKDGSWGEPINLGPKINSPEFELEPRLSPDGKYLFYSSFKKLDPAVFYNKSYGELIDLYRHPQNGYATLYWVDARIIDDLIK
jgi:Tol biopolymer transport system component